MKPRQVGTEGLPVGRVTRRERQARVTVVAPRGGHDVRAPRDAADDLDREVDRLAAGHAEHHTMDPWACGLAEAGREARAVPGREVVIADVEGVQGVAHRGDHAGVPVSEVEHAAVRVAIVEEAPVEGVAKGGAAALSHDESHPRGPKERGFSRRNVVTEVVEKRVAISVGGTRHGVIMPRPRIATASK